MAENDGNSIILKPKMQKYVEKMGVTYFNMLWKLQKNYELWKFLNKMKRMRVPNTFQQHEKFERVPTKVGKLSNFLVT